MIDIFCLFFILIASTGLGIRALKVFGFSFMDEGEGLVFGTALGLGFLSYLVFILGSFGWLYKNLFLGILTVCFVVSWKPFLNHFMILISKSPKLKQIGFLKLTIFLLMIIVLVFVLSGASAPPIGQDELCYHLTNPKVFVRDHRVSEINYSTNSLWPYLMEMLFTLGILMRGGELAKLFHTATFLLTVSAIFCLVRRFGEKKSALFAAAIYFFTPAAFMQATFGYIDNAVAGWMFLTFYALLLFFHSKEMKWAGLAGVFGGFLISTKYLGLFALPLVAVFYLFKLAKGTQKKKIFLSAILFGTFVILCGGVWYVRSALLRGNPVFPFMSGIFEHGISADQVINAAVHGRGTSPLSFLLVLWDLMVHPEWFGGEPVGMLYLAFLPLFIFSKPRPAYALNLFWAGFGFTVLWFFIEQNTRFLFPALALFSVPVGLGFANAVEASKKRWKIIFSLFFALMLVVQAGFAAYHYRDELLLVAGRMDKDHYLYKHERSYPAAKTVNRFLKPTDKILSTGESRGFYFDNPFTLEGDFNNFTHYGRAVALGEVISNLKQIGFTHILSSSLEPVLEDNAENQNRVQRILSNPASRDQFFITDLVFSHQDVRYVLYRIKY